MGATATPEEIKDLIVTELSQLADVDPALMTPEATLKDLDIDSLDLVELAQIIEERLGVTLERDDFKDVATLGEAITVIIGRCTAPAPA